MKYHSHEVSQSRDVYDRFASRYDAAFRPFERWFLGKMRAKALAEIPENSRMLEVGAGTGSNFAYYPRGTGGVASEPSGEMLSIARLKKRPEGLHFTRNSAEMLPFADHSFDCAFASLVFCSVISARDAFVELRRVVKPGGLVVLLEHVRPPGPLGWVFDAVAMITVPLFADHFNRRTAEEAARAGFAVEKIEARAMGIFQLIVLRT